MKWEDLREELFAIPGLKEEFDADFPYHDLSLEIGGLRADMDMTQTELAELSGMPQSMVARLESGRHNPSVRTLKRIAAATGTELVIEFRRPKRTRRGRKPSPGTSSAGEGRANTPIAASSANE